MSTPIILELWMVRQEAAPYEAIMGYIVSMKPDYAGNETQSQKNQNFRKSK